MNNPIYKIQIDDITIRCGEVSDALAVKEAIDMSLDHLHKFMTWSHHEPEAIEKKKERLVRWKQDFIDNKDYSVLVFRGDKMIASAGLHNRLNRNALEIGYWVRADETKKGVATKVSLALTILAFQFIKVDEVEIHHNIKNIISSKVPKKLRYRKQENYSKSDKENCRWKIDLTTFLKNQSFYSSLFKKIEFFDYDEKVIII